MHRRQLLHAKSVSLDASPANGFNNIHSAENIKLARRTLCRHLSIARFVENLNNFRIVLLNKISNMIKRVFFSRR